MSSLIHSRTVSRELARIGIEAALAEADGLNCRACVCVLDLGGHLVSFDRVDGAPFQSIAHAIDKATSVAGNGNATHEMWEYVEGNPWLLAGIGKVKGMSVLGGGVPIRLDGELIGAVGVSGSCGMAEDRLVAEAAVAAILGALSADSGGAAAGDVAAPPH
jgi:uncharacterized protein GlcG (DUF336 family)